MKFMRVGARGCEVPTVVASDGTVRNISREVADVDPDFLCSGWYREFTPADAEKSPHWEGTARVGPCVGRVGKIVCVGLNYHEHVKELKMPIPVEPVVFLKSPTAIPGPCDEIVMPRGATKVDWEVELCVIIGAEARYVREDEALQYGAGYCVINDVSERAFQLERGGQWDNGKAAILPAQLAPGS